MESDNIKLSSDYLYHFTRTEETAGLILTNGFRHSLVREQLPFSNAEQSNFMVCFCDIPFLQSESHRNCYGNFGFVMKKDWGICSRISPVRYIHQKSVGASQDYIQMRVQNRTARERADGNVEQFAFDTAIDSILVSRRDFPIDPSSVAGEIEGATRELEARFRPTIEGATQDLREILNALATRILQLHNELERRDAWMRIYEDGFDCPASGERLSLKRFYDEREWRSIKFLGESDEQCEPGIMKRSIDDGFLPPAWNLTFDDSDIRALIGSDERAVENLRKVTGAPEVQKKYPTLQENIFLFDDWIGQDGA